METKQRCEICNRKIKGAEYWTSVKDKEKRICLCEECYLDDEKLE